VLLWSSHSSNHRAMFGARSGALCGFTLII
jgi:hypothetical protein